MKKKKIIFVDNTPFIGGGQLWLADHLKNLDRKKFEPLLVIARDSSYSNAYIESDVVIKRIEFGVLKRLNPLVLLRLVKSAWQLNRLIKEVRPEVVVAFTMRAAIVSAFSKTNHKLMFYVFDHSYPKWLIFLLGLRIDKFLMISHSINHCYKGKVPQSEVFYSGSSIKEQIEKITVPQITKFRKKIGLKDSDWVVGYVGRLVESKGPQILVEAVSQIKDPKLKLVFFGTGSGQMGNVEELLYKKAKTKNLQKKVFFAGFIPDPALIYKSIDVFVLPTTLNEAFSRSLLEASFAGLPVIATNLGGTPELICHEKNGLLVESGSVSKLKEALVRLVEDKALAKRLGRQLYKDIQPFTAKERTKILERVYS